MTTPFRWNLAKREQLGKLANRGANDAYPGFIDDLRTCSSRVLAFAGNSKLVFVGRSPESIFDYLSGLLVNTSWANRCILLNISNRGYALGRIHALFPGAITGIKSQLTSLDLSPSQIIVQPRSLAFIDLVYTGGTFGHLANLMLSWAEEEQVDIPAVKRKMRFVGITSREKTSPKTWRWQQHSKWVKEFPSRVIKNVSVPWYFWDYLGDRQEKVSLSNPPWRWDDEDMERPPHWDSNLDALSLAVRLYEQGCSSTDKLEFAKQLTREPAMEYDWFRKLVIELRNSA